MDEMKPLTSSLQKKNRENIKNSIKYGQMWAISETPNEITGFYGIKWGRNKYKIIEKWSTNLKCLSKTSWTSTLLYFSQYNYQVEIGLKTIGLNLDFF